MKLAIALAAIANAPKYRVHFDRRDGVRLYGDVFPDGNEPALSDERIAFDLAAQFASACPEWVHNVYVREYRGTKDERVGDILNQYP